MPRTPQQTVRFAAPPARVFGLYADPRLHARVTGAPARFKPVVGGEFVAYGGPIRGRMLALERPRPIVQTWRGADWKAREPDSVLILTFTAQGRGTTLRRVHANVPDAHAAGIRGGRRQLYWTPWRRALAAR